MRILQFVLFCFVAVLAGCGGGSTPQGQEPGPGSPILSLGLTEKGKVRVSYVDSGKVSTEDFEVGEKGRGLDEGATAIQTMNLTWPADRTFEAAFDFDSKGTNRGLKLAASGFSDVSATRDNQAVTLPAALPGGKYRVVIKGTCPQ